MKEVKRIVLRILFGFEISFFMYVYLFGSQGIQAWMQVKKENAIVEQEIERLHNEIAHLTNQIVDWQQDILGKEKIAREQLQMARKGDEIYYF